MFFPTVVKPRDSFVFLSASPAICAGCRFQNLGGIRVALYGDLIKLPRESNPSMIGAGNGMESIYNGVSFTF